jgi:predicted nucleotidyltransferase
MAPARAREGDLIENMNGAVFDVKGLVHPPDRVVAFIRYFPDKNGDRTRYRTTYGKVYSLSDRYALLKDKYPEYLVYDPVFDETLCEVPDSHVRKRFDPVTKLDEMRSAGDLDALERKALELGEMLRQQANVSWDAVGISGSILAGLHTSRSDIDPVVYGSENCRQINDALKELVKHGSQGLKSYGLADLKALFEFRSRDTKMSFEDFVRTESNKAFQGEFMDTDYFVRFVKDWREADEAYGDVHYRNMGQGKIEATVADDSEALFTPCAYAVESVTILEGPTLQPVSQIVSFRGRFCEQAKTGDRVVACGKVERVTDKNGTVHYRLLVGGRPSDYIIPRR